MSVEYFCPCLEPVGPVRDTNYPTTLGDPATFHSLASLQFCPVCRQVKCHICMQQNIVAKFCPQCQHRMPADAVHCSRSCFRCPNCPGTLVVTARNMKGPKGKVVGKDFHFRCALCKWRWSTGVIRKPQSLQTIVQSLKEESDPLSVRFAELKDFIVEQFEKEATNKEVTGKAKASTFDPAVDTFNASTFPVPREVRSRYELHCKTCKEMLAAPVVDKASGKHSTSFIAADFVPRIWVSRQRGDSGHGYWQVNDTFPILLSFCNPLTEPINITLSAPASLDEFNKGTNTKLFLPCENFTVGACPDGDLRRLDNYVKTIPTVLLTQKSKYSRIELITRPADSLAKISSKGGRRKSLEEESTFIGSPVDTGQNWCTICAGIDVRNPEVSSSVTLESLRVPFLMKVDCRAITFSVWIGLTLPRDHVSQARKARVRMKVS